MLTTITLNNVETNQDVKYKCLTYGSGIGNTFLDEASFPVEDHITDFELNQAYTNWLTLIEMFSDPAMEQGWHAHHKCMVSDRGFIKWAQAWHVHNHLLHSQFMQKPLMSSILPTRSSSCDASLTKLYDACVVSHVAICTWDCAT